jgi:hypothetical protein
LVTIGGCCCIGVTSAGEFHIKFVFPHGVDEDKPGRIGFKLGLTMADFLVDFGPATGLVLGMEVNLCFFSLLLVFGGTRLLLRPSRPRFIMLAGVTGEIVSSGSAKPTFFDSTFKISFGGDGLACGGMENSWPDEPAPTKLEAIVIGVEVADLVARFRTTGVTNDDLRLEAGLSEVPSSLGDALRLLEMARAGCWV